MPMQYNHNGNQSLCSFEKLHTYYVLLCNYNYKMLPTIHLHTYYITGFPFFFLLQVYLRMYFSRH